MPHHKKEKLAIAEYLVWARSARRLPLSPSQTSSDIVNQSYYSSLERPNSVSGSFSTPSFRQVLAINWSWYTGWYLSAPPCLRVWLWLGTFVYLPVMGAFATQVQVRSYTRKAKVIITQKCSLKELTTLLFYTSSAIPLLSHQPVPLR